MTAGDGSGEVARARALRRLVAVQCVSMGAMEMSGPFWPLHLRDLGGLSGASLAWASALAYAGPLFAAMCVAPAWGRLADRAGHKPMLLRALVALAATQAWIALADSVASVLCARLAQGALAGFVAAAHGYGARLCAPAGRGRAMARLHAATAVGSMAGPVAGGLLYASLGFGAVNLLAAVLCALCALTVWRLLPVLPRGATAPPPRRAPVADPATPAPAGTDAPAPVRAIAAGVAGLLLGIVLVQTARTLPQSWFGLYAEGVLGLPAWATGLCHGATAAGLCLGAPWWAARLEGRAQTRVLGEASLACAACALLALAQAPGVAAAALLAARFAWGLALGALLPVLQTLLSRDTPDAAQGFVMGLGGSAAKAGALAGTLLGAAALAALPPARLMWPVAAAYALSALGLHALRARSRTRATAAGTGACGAA